MPWDTNPLYALLHEAIYCQNNASCWAAHRIRNSEFSEQFDAAQAVATGNPVMFTGVHVMLCMLTVFCLGSWRESMMTGMMWRHMKGASCHWDTRSNVVGKYVLVLACTNGIWHSVFYS